MKTMTSRAFNQDVGQAKRDARFEPVFVTDRGRPTHVLVSIDTFRQLAGQGGSILDLLAMPALVGTDDVAGRAASEFDRQGERR